jgi:DNA-binding MarR family transcriptional regulator
MSSPRRLDDADFARLLGFRDALRRFVRWSEDEAKRSGLTPAQHQLLLAVRGHPGARPSVGEIADHLLLRHHSVVELVDRAESAGLVRRIVDSSDHRIVHVALTAEGTRHLTRLSAAHLDELERFAQLPALLT